MAYSTWPIAEPCKPMSTLHMSSFNVRKVEHLFLHQHSIDLILMNEIENGNGNDQRGKDD